VDTETSKTVVRLRSMQAAQQTTGKVLPKGKVNQYTPEEVVAQIAEPQKVRARRNSVSPRTQRKLDKLARDRPDILEQLQRPGQERVVCLPCERGE
jgi:hypothetical protein